MAKEYRHKGFETDQEFVEHHQRKARAGDEVSKGVIATRSRLEAAERNRKTAELQAAAVEAPE